MYSGNQVIFIKITSNLDKKILSYNDFFWISFCWNSWVRLFLYQKNVYKSVVKVDPRTEQHQQWQKNILSKSEIVLQVERDV